MIAIWALAKATVQEAIRRRVLNVLLLFAVATVFFSQVFKSFAPGEEEKFLIDMGINTVRLFGVLIAIVLGASLIPTEIERKTIHVILAKPVNRTHFIVGKFLGSAIAVVGSAALMAAVFLVVYRIRQGPISTAMFAGTAMTLFEILIFNSIVTAVASFSSSIFVVVFSIAAYLLGHIYTLFEEMGKVAEHMYTRVMLGLVGAVAPHMEMYDFTRPILLEQPIKLMDVLGPIGYAFLYSFIMLGVALIFFDRREF